MPYGALLVARRLEHGKFNRFLAALSPHDFSLLAPHLRTIPLERSVMLHDVGEEIEHVYFPHSGMVSFVAVMQSGATVETATIGRAGVIGASAGLGARSTIATGDRAVARHGRLDLGLSVACGRGPKRGHSRPHRALQRYLACAGAAVCRVQCAAWPRGQALPLATANA